MAHFSHVVPEDVRVFLILCSGVESDRCKKEWQCDDHALDALLQASEK